MKSRTIAALTAVLLLALAAPAAARTGYANSLPQAGAHAGEVLNELDTDGYVGTRGWRSSTFVVGDSVARIGLLNGLRPLGLGRGWEVSSVSGRDVSTLPYYLRDRVAAQGAYKIHRSKKWRRHHPHARLWRHRYPVRRAVIALGSNATPGWTYGDLRASVNLLPASTVVVLVTPFRDPAQWPNAKPYRQRASVVGVYANWAARIAELRPRTCIADWRGFAQRYPSATHDGVHPTTAGAKGWAKIVAGAVAHCS